MATVRVRHTGLRAAVDHLFGYDVFISYSRGDSAPFARGLATELEELDLSCFLDENELPAGYPLSGTLRAALRRSSVLALVSTKAARASTFVAMEVGTFAATKRPIVPIVIREVDGDIPEEQPDIPWESIRDRELVWVSDVADAVSASTVKAVRDALRVTRKRTLASRVMFGAAAALLLVSLFAGGAAVVAIREQQRAEREARVARLEAAHARAEEKRAQHATLEAERRRAILNVESLARQALTGNQQSEQTLLIASEAVRRARASHLQVANLAEHALRQTIARMGGKPLGAAPLLESYTPTSRRDPFFFSAGKGSGLVISRIRDGALKRVANVPESVSAISADGRSIASCSSEVLVLRDWRRQAAFHAGDAAHGTCALSGDGRWLAFGDFAYDLTARDVPRSGVQLAELSFPRFRFSDDGKWLIASSDQDLWLWAVEASGPERPPRLQVRSDDWLDVPSLTSTSDFGAIPVSSPKPPPDPALVPRAVEAGDVDIQHSIDEKVAWSNDGRWLATATRSSAIVRDLHDPGLHTRVLDLTVENPYRLPAVLFSASSQWLIVNGQTPRAYRAPSFRRGIPIGTLPVTAIAASEDGHWLATATQDVRVWDLTAPAPFATPRYVLRGAMSRMETMESLGGVVRSLVFSPNGRWLISASASAELWDLQQPDPSLAPIALTLPDLTKLRFIPNPDSWFLRYWFTADSRYLILCGAEGLDDDLPSHYALYPLEGDDLLQFASANLRRGFTDAERKWLFPEETTASAAPGQSP